MDTSNLIINYSAGDFADAYRGLLPKGEYWQGIENAELTNTINGIAKDFKQTHDDIELSLLTEFEEQGFGWKISDYQGLLIRSDGNGIVFDDVAKPNLIYVSLDTNIRCEKAWFEFERVRLPHTEIEWIYNSAINVQTQVVNARHIRNLYQHEVTQ